MISDHLRTYQRGLWEVRLDFVNFCEGSNWFDDLYTKADKHEGGTTIAIPAQYRTNWDIRNRRNQFVVGQYKPSQLASEYAAQGRDNPSYEAYRSLQLELEHYITASDCAIQCTVSYDGIELAETLSTTFDTSDIEGFYATNEEHWARIRADYGHDFVSEAIKAAREKILELKTTINRAASALHH